jgi:hypothetical protein
MDTKALFIEEIDMQDESSTRQLSWQLPTWIAIVVIACVAFTFAFACAMPFAAVAAVAACTLSRRDACYLAGAAWLASQAVGFAFLHYPLTWDCLAWGAILGMTAILSTLAAAEATRRLGRRLAGIGVAFLAAFTTCEVVLFTSSLVLGGIENYTVAIQGRFLGLNVVVLAGLLVLSRAGVLAGIAPPVRPRLATANPRP